MKFSAKLHPTISSQKIQIFLCGRKEKDKNYHSFFKLEISSRVLIARTRYQINHQVSTSEEGFNSPWVSTHHGYQPDIRPGIYKGNQGIIRVWDSGITKGNEGTWEGQVWG
jgi:hypothetical protein